MELNGAAYLYNLSVIATTFAGFSGLTVIFREILGGKLTRLDSFVIRIFIQLGFMAAFGAILPPLFHLFELSPPVIWRAASILMALILGAWSFTYPMRRHAASPTPAPKPIWFVVAVLDFAALALAGNAIWPSSRYAAGIYSAAVTIMLAGGASFFLFSLIFLFAKPVESSTPAPKD